jgi:Rrf2 family protein
MANMLRISEAASLALHTMALLASNSGAKQTTWEIAKTLRVSEAHLAKVLQRLGRAGLVKSQRGPGGGFSLGRAPDTITLLDVYEATEGPLQPPGCLLGRPACNGSCILGGLLEQVGAEIRDYFAQTRLSDLKGQFIREEKYAS